MRYLSIIFVIVTQSCITIASDGDRSPFYKSCVRTCSSMKCSQDGQHFVNEAAQSHQDVWSKALFWNCKDECQYHCMWKTVNAFIERGYDVPKFHGKWPFTRMLGVQEPASAFCSFLNLATHSYMQSELRHWFKRENTPLVLFWKIFTFICLHAWIWSTIFHTRDMPFTEFMDYACALSMVMALFAAAIIRMGSHLWFPHAQSFLEDDDDLVVQVPDRTPPATPSPIIVPPNPRDRFMKKGRKRQKKQIKLDHASYVISKMPRRALRSIKIEICDINSDTPSPEISESIVCAKYIVTEVVDEIMDMTENLVKKISKKLSEDCIDM